MKLYAREGGGVIHGKDPKHLIVHVFDIVVSPSDKSLFDQAIVLNIVTAWCGDTGGGSLAPTYSLISCINDLYQ